MVNKFLPIRIYISIGFAFSLYFLLLSNIFCMHVVFWGFVYIISIMEKWILIYQ